MRNTTALQYLVNQRLAKRSGVIGRIFKSLEMGPREYSQHALGRFFRVGNIVWMQFYQLNSMMRPTLSRMVVGVSQGPLNYSGMFMWFWLTALIIARFRFIRGRDLQVFNAQDNPEFWFARYNMMFPPSFLHNRISAHYIEINHIFNVEMLKRYQIARKEILADREKHSDHDKRTKYILNSNYVYEPMGADDDKIKRAKAEGTF